MANEELKRILKQLDDLYKKAERIGTLLEKFETLDIDIEEYAQDWRTFAHTRHIYCGDPSCDICHSRREEKNYDD